LIALGSKAKISNNNQTQLDFEKVRWPENDKFPLNQKNRNRSVESIIYQDIKDSENYIIVTGFTSLSNIVDFFGSQDFEKLKKVCILIGFEPNIRGRKKYLKFNLDREIKDYWLKKGLSIMLGGAVINLIEKIRSSTIEFRYRDKLHAKLYVGDRHAILGSSNFSINGLTLQEEANIRVHNSSSFEIERDQYGGVRQIANSYYEDALSYNETMIDLLERLIQKVTWEEALARAIAEIIEGEWLKEYKDILERLEDTNLWPTQWKGLAQAISILQNQSNVLIADPTGAGKTKLCTSLVLALKHWLFEVGKNYRTDSLIICPPMVIGKWEEEFRSLRNINNTRSMGILSNSSIINKKKIIEELDIANILTIDEAHNYLSPTSNRTKLIKNNKADFKILVTATPISKKVEDLLRLIELLDIDNLSDEDFEIYKNLLHKPYLRNKQENINSLRKFISKFTVRRTKKILNREIDKESDKYINLLGNTCRFPNQIEQTYETRETPEDIKIVLKINELTQQLKGVTYLTTFYKPKYEISKEDALRNYIQRRLSSGRALPIYQIRAALRSSHVALVEHIEGSKKASDYFGFKTKKNATGDQIAKIQKIIDHGKLPKRNRLFKKEYFPIWLVNKETYLATCTAELKIYKEIGNLAKKLSGQREHGKVEELIRISKIHGDVLAFDSTVITLYYLRHLFRSKFSDWNVLVASGSDKDKESKKVLEVFKLDSDTKENYIALCSDKMSESIDLQKASCIVLMDLPSVLRIVEQRIGRIDRMDSMHKRIEIYWPVDSDAYSLNADRRLIETNTMVEQIYGSNFNIPRELLERKFENVQSVAAIIQEYKDFVDKDESWTGIHDSFQSVMDLKEGGNSLIDEQVYEEIRSQSTTIKTRVSFLQTDSEWCFIAMKGSKSKSPKWYFIDRENQIHTDFPDICRQLRAHITNKSKGLDWNDKALRKYVKLFKLKERDLLPPKKKRALEVAEYILGKKIEDKNVSEQKKKLIKTMLDFLKPNPREVVDYERLSEDWIDLLQPYLNKKRLKNTRKKEVHNLSSLKRSHKSITFEEKQLLKIIENSPIVDDIDNKIASCIIGVKERKG